VIQETSFRRVHAEKNTNAGKLWQNLRFKSKREGTMLVDQIEVGKFRICVP
jgi:hypothetical protein